MNLRSFIISEDPIGEGLSRKIPTENSSQDSRDDPKAQKKSEDAPTLFLSAALDETVRVWHMDKPKAPLVILTVPKVMYKSKLYFM